MKNHGNDLVSNAKWFDRFFFRLQNFKMATVSKVFETSGDSKEVSLSKKIAELKKRLVLAGKYLNESL